VNHRIAVGVVVLGLSIGVTARAQPVSSFEDPHGLIERGADVVVTHDGRHAEGHVLELSPTSLAAVSEGRLLDARKTEMRDVHRVLPRRSRTSVAPLPSRDRLGGPLSISW